LDDSEVSGLETFKALNLNLKVCAVYIEFKSFVFFDLKTLPTSPPNPLPNPSWQPPLSPLRVPRSPSGALVLINSAAPT